LVEKTYFKSKPRERLVFDSTSSTSTGEQTQPKEKHKVELAKRKRKYFAVRKYISSMEAFISRKKRKLSPNSHFATQTRNPDYSQGPCQTLKAEAQSNSDLNTQFTEDDEETESTDFKLALLSSLHPETDQQLLLDVLLAHDGSVDEASAALTTDSASPSSKNTSSASHSTSLSGTAATGYQSSLSNFISQSEANSADPNSLSKKAKLLTKHGKTLHLYSPSDVEAHTPCSIIHNFLPGDEANALLKELLDEAESFERSSFKLFDNVVQSPHTSCFYVESLEEVETQKTEYIYNGGKLDVSFFSLSFSHDYCSRVAHGYFFLDGQAFSLTLLFPSSRHQHKVSLFLF